MQLGADTAKLELTEVRKVMKALSQFRELDSNFDIKVHPLEEIYLTLQKYKFNVNKEEMDTFDQLRSNMQGLQSRAFVSSKMLYEV